MMSAEDILAALEKIDQQLVRLISDRRELVSQMPGGISVDQELEIMSLWIDEAVERELDEVTMEKMGKLISQLCRRRGE